MTHGLLPEARDPRVHVLQDGERIGGIATALVGLPPTDRNLRTVKKQELKDRIADLEWQVEHWKKAAARVEGVRSKERAHIAALERRIAELEIDARDYKREADHLRELQQPFEPDSAVYEHDSERGGWQINAEGIRQLSEYIEDIKRRYSAPPSPDQGWKS